MATRCGGVVCLDDDSYCCLDSNDVETCCTTFYIYQTWWFWFIWIMFLLILLSCVVGCYRSFRRRRQMNYVVLRNPQQPPVYGSVVVTSNVHGAVGRTAAPTAPVQPPPYAAYPHDKPPAYAAS